MHAREGWLWENNAALAQVKNGLQDSTSPALADSNFY